MFKFRLRKISHKLTIVYALIFFVALVSVNGVTLFSISYYMNQTSSQQLELIAGTISKEVRTLADIQKIDFKNISQMSENIDINLTYNNRIIYDTGERYDLPFPEDRTVNKIMTAAVGENKILYLSGVSKLSDGGEIGIQVVKDMDNEQDYLQALSGIMLLVDAVILLISLFVGYIISKNALSPIDKITKQAKQISAHDLTARIRIDGPDDELKRLSDTFNDMIARIECSYEKQNRFTLDASHELATPLAVIKGYIDVLDRWGKEDREVLNEGIESIKAELTNMTRLLDTLLFISKSDNEIIKPEKTLFQLDDLIKEVVKESKFIANQREILFKEKKPLQMEGDQRLIKQMLRAIVDNSIKYTPDSGKIEIGMEAMKGQAVITVADTGIGIPKEDLPNIFDRFYRVDKARSRTVGGAGLGLSIVKWIVDVHHGQITAESEPGSGTKITVKLPL